jgi:hypothetical protein
MQKISLLANGAAVGFVTGHATAGTFTDIAVTYTATGTDAGKAIGINLLAENTGSGFEQGAFDNVRLSFDSAASATPEPGSASLLGIGAALVAFGRRFGMRLAKRSRA